MTTEPDAAVPDSVTYREIQEVLRTFAASGWSRMQLDVRGIQIVVGKDGPPTAAPASPGAPAPAPTPLSAPASRPVPGAAAPGPPPVAAPGPPPVAAAPIDAEGLVAVRSPAIGAFWVAPSPGQPPFVEVGQPVAQDQQLAIVEVMKLMNPVVATQPGEVVQVCAANAAMVEYDQVLFLIRPDDG